MNEIKILTQRELIQSAPVRYRNGPGIYPDVLRELDACDFDTISAEALHEIVCKDPSWTKYACDICKRLVPEVARVSGTARVSYAYVCESCIDDVAAGFRRARDDREEDEVRSKVVAWWDGVVGVVPSAKLHVCPCELEDIARAVLGRSPCISEMRRVRSALVKLGFRSEPGVSGRMIPPATGSTR